MIPRRLILLGLLLTPLTLPAYSLGWVITGSWAVAVLRAKIRMIPSSVILPGGSVDENGRIILKEPFSIITNACGRNAEVEFRLDWPANLSVPPMQRKLDAFRDSLREELLAFCAHSIELAFLPLVQPGTPALLSWPRMIRATLKKEWVLKMLIPPIGADSATFGHVTKATAVALLNELDGLNIKVADLGPQMTAERYRKILAENLKWAEEQATRTGKVISLLVNGTVNFENSDTPAAEAPTQTIEALKAFPKKALSQFCLGKIRLVINSGRINDIEQDRKFAGLEKWAVDYCAAY